MPDTTASPGASDGAPPRRRGGRRRRDRGGPLPLARRASPLEEAAVAGEIAALLVRLPPPPGLRRVAVALSGPAGTQHFTFRREADGAFREEQVYRGIHPMLALRLELWRLRNFHLERLPAPDGVYLFHGVAHENPRDERLFAVAEVRDLTPVRDEAGRIVHLPQLEHRLMEALAGLRRFQSRRATADRLAWNRVLLNVWPPVDLRPDEIESLVRRLAPLTEGVGLEKVAVRCRIPDRESGELRDRVLEISNFERARRGPALPQALGSAAEAAAGVRPEGGRPAPPRPPLPLRGDQTAGATHASQADLPAGDFVEHDLDDEGRLVPVDRPLRRQHGQRRGGRHP